MLHLYPGPSSGTTQVFVSHYLTAWGIPMVFDQKSKEKNHVLFINHNVFARFGCCYRQHTKQYGFGNKIYDVEPSTFVVSHYFLLFLGGRGYRGSSYFAKAANEIL